MSAADAPTGGITVERAGVDPDTDTPPVETPPEPAAVIDEEPAPEPAPEATEADTAAKEALQRQEDQRLADAERLADEQAAEQADLAAARPAVPTETADERPMPQVPTGGDTHVHLTTQPRTHETWVNVTRGRVVLIFGDGRGGKRHEIIASKRPFQITPAERLMNQHTAATEKQDPFLNGTLQPVELIDGLPPHEQARYSPNHVGKEEMNDLFATDGPTFRKRIASIENETALKALLELAVTPDVDARHSQIELIRARLDEVAERPIEHVKAGAAEAGAAGGGGMAGIGRAVTPK